MLMRVLTMWYTKITMASRKRMQQVKAAIAAGLPQSPGEFKWVLRPCLYIIFTSRLLLSLVFAIF